MDNTLRDRRSVPADADPVEALVRSAHGLTLAAGETRLAIRLLARSLNRPGTRGRAEPGTVRDQMGRLARLVALYDAAAGRLLSAARRLRDGAAPADARRDVVLYARFLRDQLEPEAREADRLLRRWRGDDSETPGPPPSIEGARGRSSDGAGPPA